MLIPLFRAIKIANTVARYRLYALLPADSTTRRLLATLSCLMPGRWYGSTADDPSRLRQALEALGPIYIKLGQMLSTRPDLLSEPLVQELTLLQDQVPGFDPDIAIATIEQELHRPIDQLFARFDREPLASASVAQVHTAQLPDESEVIVKIIRPGIANTVRSDIALMKLIARLLERWVPLLRRFHPLAVIEDYERTILDELSLVQEANNTQKLGRNFDCSPLLYVPEVKWPLVTPNVMVAERIYGVPITDLDTLKAAGVDMEKLARRGVEIFFTQVFRDNFFHADMHPGNIYVSTAQPDSPQYIALDCAIIGSLTKADQLLLARQLMALLQKNYEQLAQLLAHSGWVPEDVRIHEFALALQTVCDPIFDKPLDEIEFGPILVNLFRTARQFDIEALPQFVLLEKTLLHIEGLGRQIYPALDIWEIGRPLLENWLREQIGPEAILTELKRSLPLWIEQLPTLPQLAYDTLHQLKQNNQVQANHRKIQSYREQRQRQQQQRQQRQRWCGLALIAAAALSASPAPILAQLTEIPLTSWALAAGGLYLVNPFNRTTT